MPAYLSIGPFGPIGILYTLRAKAFTRRKAGALPPVCTVHQLESMNPATVFEAKGISKVYHVGEVDVYALRQSGHRFLRRRQASSRHSTGFAATHTFKRETAPTNDPVARR